MLACAPALAGPVEASTAGPVPLTAWAGGKRAVGVWSVGALKGREEATGRLLRAAGEALVGLGRFRVMEREGQESPAAWLTASVAEALLVGPVLMTHADFVKQDLVQEDVVERDGSGRERTMRRTVWKPRAMHEARVVVPLARVQVASGLTLTATVAEGVVTTEVRDGVDLIGAFLGGLFGRTTPEALAEAQVRRGLVEVIRGLYALEAPVEEVGGGELSAPLGVEVGVQPGMRFRVLRIGPEATREVGVAEVVRAGESRLRARLIREFDEVRSGDALSELMTAGASVGVSVVRLPEGWNACVLMEQEALARFSYGWQFDLGLQTTFGRAELLPLVGVGLTGRIRLWRGGAGQLTADVTAMLSSAVRTDDAGRTVALLIPSVAAGPTAEWFLGPHLSLLAGAHFALAEPWGGWSAVEGGATVPATWTSAAPTVALRGGRLVMGLKWAWW